MSNYSSCKNILAKTTTLTKRQSTYPTRQTKMLKKIVLVKNSWTVPRLVDMALFHYRKWLNKRENL